MQQQLSSWPHAYTTPCPSEPEINELFICFSFCLPVHPSIHLPMNTTQWAVACSPKWSTWLGRWTFSFYFLSMVNPRDLPTVLHPIQSFSLEFPGPLPFKHVSRACDFASSVSPQKHVLIVQDIASLLSEGIADHASHSLRFPVRLFCTLQKWQIMQFSTFESVLSGIQIWNGYPEDGHPSSVPQQFCYFPGLARCLLTHVDPIFHFFTFLLPLQQHDLSALGVALQSGIYSLDLH